MWKGGQNGEQMEAMGSESLISGMEVGMKRGGVQKNVFIR